MAITDTVRGAAGLLGLHHSTVQQRQTRIEGILGFRLSDPVGRLRGLAALAVHRVREARASAEPTQ